MHKQTPLTHLAGPMHGARAADSTDFPAATGASGAGGSTAPANPTACPSPTYSTPDHATQYATPGVETPPEPREAAAVRRALPDFHWEGVESMRYKDEGTAPFRDVTRQVLFQLPELHCEWRYFEVAPGGHSTLECHEHAHAVMVLRGRGECLVGERIYQLAERDLVTVPPNTWHQFRAAEDAPLGFMCLVNRERDRPRLPEPDDIEDLRRDSNRARFIRTVS